MADHLLTHDLSFPGFNAAREPVLTVSPGAGDYITFETDDLLYQQMDAYRDMNRVDAPFNPVTGPVYIEGASPGDLLAVTVEKITFGEYGWSVYVPGIGALAGPMGDQWFCRRIPLADGRVQLTTSIDCPVTPMIGCIGVAAAASDMSTYMPSYPTGGNMDITDVAPGSTVLLPVQVPGALLSIGDLHAVMSRGESSFIAIEAAGRATVTIDLVKAREAFTELRAPRIDTKDEIICVGLGNPLQASIKMAYESLFAVLTNEYRLSKEDTYTLMSALAHTELGGPTGSATPDPLHPNRPVGAVTLARISKHLLARALS